MKSKTVKKNSSAFKENKPTKLLIDRSDKCDNEDINNLETNKETTKYSDAIPMTLR